MCNAQTYTTRLPLFFATAVRHSSPQLVNLLEKCVRLSLSFTKQNALQVSVLRAASAALVEASQKAVALAPWRRSVAVHHKKVSIKDTNSFPAIKYKAVLTVVIEKE